MSMLGLVRLCRLYYALPMSAGYLLTVYYARGGRMEGFWLESLMSAAALALVIAAGYVLNDVWDRRIDQVTHRRRPIVCGQVSAVTAAIFGALLWLGGLVVSFHGRPAFTLTLAVVGLCLVLYDAYSKRLGAAKQLVVAALMTSIYPLALAEAGGASGPRAASLAVFPVWLSITSFGYEILKDLRDLPIDPPLAGRPSPLRANPLRWRLIANLAIAGSSLILFAPALLGCGWIYLCAVMVAVGLAWAVSRAKVAAAIPLVYTEVFLVAIAAAADVMILGV